MRGTLRLWGPALFLLALVTAPLWTGTRTLFLRDVFFTHVPFKAATVAAWTAASPPLLDPLRAGGQPLFGNPNAVTFYPTDLLYLGGNFFWALNAHFWLHWLLAPFAMAALARACGLGRVGAATAGLLYATSGFFLSQLAFYNLIASATVGPAVLAAVLRARVATTSGSAWRWAALTGLGWWLVLIGGDPMSAAVVGLLAVSAVVALPAAGLPAAVTAGQVAAVGTAPSAGDATRRPPRSWLPLPLAGLAGTALAAPQLGEFLRILPLSLRGHRGYGGDVATISSLDPRSLIEWVVPLFFGRTDVLETGSFWGFRFYTDTLPYYTSLAPGLLTLILAAAAGWRARVTRWAWIVLTVAFALALGRFNPLAAAVFSLGGWLRFPIKLWLAGAMALALLAGVGAERWWVGRERGAARRGCWVTAGLACALGLGVTVSTVAADGWDRQLAVVMARQAPDGGRMVPPLAATAAERTRQRELLLSSLGLLVALAGGLRLVVGHPQRVGWLLALQVAGQLVLLAPVRATDLVAPYLVPPPLLAAIPPDALVVHGARGFLFGPPGAAAQTFPAAETRYVNRAMDEELYPSSGVRWGVHYELDTSPEGLDSFLTETARAVVVQLQDRERVRLLAALGVTHLLLDRPLAPLAADLVEQVAAAVVHGRPLYLWRLRGVAPEVGLFAAPRPAPSLNEAVELLLAPGFDPRREVVVATAAADEDSPADGNGLAGGDPAGAPTAGRARLVRREAERLEIHTEAPHAGLLVVRRAHLDLWRATVDGEEAPLEVANLLRLAVRVPAGRHEVVFAVDRTPLHRNLLVAALGAVVLGLLALRGWRLSGVLRRTMPARSGERRVEQLGEGDLR